MLNSSPLIALVKPGYSPTLAGSVITMSSAADPFTKHEAGLTSRDPCDEALERVVRPSLASEYITPQAEGGRELIVNSGKFSRPRRTGGINY